MNSLFDAWCGLLDGQCDRLDDQPVEIYGRCAHLDSWFRRLVVCCGRLVGQCG